MTTKNLKNVLALTGFMITSICMSAVPYMVKWFMALYVIYLISIWLDSNEDHD